MLRERAKTFISEQITVRAWYLDGKPEVGYDQWVFIGQCEDDSYLYNVYAKGLFDKFENRYVGLRLQTADDAEVKSSDWRIYI